MNMKIKLSALSLLLLLSSAICAQTASKDSTTRAQIKQIKLSEKYLYADAVSREGYDDALRSAVEELRILAATFLSEQGKEKAESKKTLEQLDTICQHLQYNQMGMFKAFVYASKKHLLGLGNKPVTAAEEAQANALSGISMENESTDENESDEGTTWSNTSGTDVEDKFAKESEFVMNEQEGTSSDSNANEPQPQREPQPVPVSPDTVAVAQTTEADTTALPVETREATIVETAHLEDTIPDKEQRVLNDLLAMDTYESVMLYLSAMKEDGRLMYGKMSTLRSPQEVYLVIVKDGQLLTILDKGSKKRLNLKTRQEEDIQKYKGHAVIWLKVFH